MDKSIQKWFYPFVIAVSGTAWLTLVHSSYADNLKFIKNKPHKDSLKTTLKLGNKLETKEIKQMVNSSAYW